MIKGYRYIISPLLPQSCRFTPTCSRYAMQAIEEHGTLRGGLLSFWRIIRCHPFCQGGYDPVPPVVGCGKTPETMSEKKTALTKRVVFKR